MSDLGLVDLLEGLGCFFVVFFNKKTPCEQVGQELSEVIAAAASVNMAAFTGVVN